jgi:prephenate dehydrogenase/chorismate mutase
MMEITRSIIDLVYARQKLSANIAAVKSSINSPIENKYVERKLISEISRYAKKIGLEADIAESIVSELIEDSKQVQRERLFGESVRKYLHSKRIKSVGVIGAGRMGGWFANYFMKMGTDVSIFDEDRVRAREKSRELGCAFAGNLEQLVASGLVIVAVPIGITPTLISDFAHRASANKTERLRRKIKVIEISSVKNEMGRAGLFDSGRARSGIELYSIHPLFGSDTPLFSAKTMIQIYPAGDNFIEKLFPHFRFLELDWKTHDMLMGILLSLPHAIALVFADIVSKAHGKVRHLDQVNSSSFDRLTDLSLRVLGENPDIYFEIQNLNPHSKEAFGQLHSSLEQFEASLNDASKFRNYFEAPKRLSNRPR